MLRIHTPFLAAALAACGPFMQGDANMDDVQLSLQPPPAAAGAATTLVLANRSPATLGYNLCTSALQRRDGEEWQPVPEDRVCTMELRMLPPGENARFDLTLPAQLEPAEYRYGTRIENVDTNESGEVYTEAFQVR